MYIYNVTINNVKCARPMAAMDEGRHIAMLLGKFSKA